MVTLARPPTRSSLKITNRSFRYAAPVYGMNSPSCSFSYHTWQFIIFTFSTITACIISYSLRISFRTQDLALQQMLSSIDLFVFYRTDYTDSRAMLNGCTGKCVRLSRPLVGFWTHFKSPHFHSFIHSSPEATKQKCKIRTKAVGKGSREILCEFGDPSISPERMKLETSHLARIGPKLRAVLTI